jgi:hypothetical protein
VDRYEVSKFKDKTVCDLFKQRMNEAMSNLHINQLVPGFSQKNFSQIGSVVFSVIAVEEKPLQFYI